MKMDLVQRCYFKGETAFDREHQLFSDVSITSCAIKPRRKSQRSARPEVQHRVDG